MKLLKILFKPKNDPQELYNQAMSHIKQDEWGKAADLLKKGTLLFPDDAVFHYTYAAALVKSGQTNPPAEIEGKLSIVCLEYIAALDKHDQFGGLESNHIRLACDAVANFCRVAKKFDEANRLAKRGLQYFPQDPYFLSLQAQIYWEAGYPEDTEKWAHKSLEVDRENDNARKIWKKARKAQGRNFYSDLPEEKKQSIFKEFCEIKNDKFLTDLGGLEREQDNLTSFVALQNIIDKSSQYIK